MNSLASFAFCNAVGKTILKLFRCIVGLSKRVNMLMLVEPEEGTYKYGMG